MCGVMRALRLDWPIYYKYLNFLDVSIIEGKKQKLHTNTIGSLLHCLVEALYVSHKVKKMVRANHEKHFKHL